jgi:uncharacterized membrane protein YeiH
MEVLVRRRSPETSAYGRMVLSEHVLVNTLLMAFDLGGTFVFALSGATAGVKNRLDLFGVLVLSFAAGNSGGIARDLLIGAVPPAAIADWRYIAVSVLVDCPGDSVTI